MSSHVGVRLSIMNFLIVFLGGAIGASLRYLVLLFFPAGLVLWFVNGLGSFLMGCLQAYFSAKSAPKWKLFLTTGMLGAFTTFSAFTVEWFALMKLSFFSSFFYMVGMTIFCTAVASLGYLLIHKSRGAI